MIYYSKEAAIDYDIDGEAIPKNIIYLNSCGLIMIANTMGLWD